ncbi:MAG TPA: DUF4350 domain-containing protein [Saprospiraceae bacterium]|nr:DUF4350 domain-containing protein [Saprospiraceae bacterium]HMQ83154.1 DUF4350 domain-containing protein [Saprospiraceae bacterium]
MVILRTLFLVLFTAVSHFATAQQVADTAFVYTSKQPKYAAGKGSTIQIDEAHFNFHTLNGRYAPFAKVLELDGYEVGANTEPFDLQRLQSCRILVISNPLDSSNVGNWSLPNHSAFTNSEIEAVNQWVKSGGRLLLIADHMPFAGAAEALGRSFEFEFLNCFAFDNRQRNFERFYAGNGSLLPHSITQGIDTLVTFTGSAFRIPDSATPLLALKNYTLLMPDTAWQFEETTPYESGDGYFQGACMHYGKGRIVVMGEAAMFSAQLAGPNRNQIGMNTPEAGQNAQFLLNIIHWLDE